MLTLSSEALTLGTRLAERVVQKDELAALTCVRLRGEAGVLWVIGASRQGGVAAPLGAKVEQPMDVLVPMRVFGDVLRTVERGASVTLSVTEQANKLIVTRPGATRTTSTIFTVASDPNQFHAVPAIADPDAVVQLEGNTLREVIPQVVFAAASDKARPLLLSTHLVIERDGHAFLEAADGFHAVRRDFAVRSTTNAVNTLIMATSLGNVPQLLALDADDDTVTLTFGNGRVLIHYAGAYFWARCEPGADRFPDLGRVLPVETPVARASVPQKEVARALRAVDVYAREDGGGAVLQFRPGLLALYAAAAELGDTQPVVPCSTEGNGDVWGDVHRLKEAVAAMPHGDIQFHFHGPARAVVLQPGETSFRYALMPMTGKGKPPEPELVQMSLLGGPGSLAADDSEDALVKNSDLLALAEASYSAAKIAEEGKVKKPFAHKGQQYVCVGLVPGQEADCRRVVPHGEYYGVTHSDRSQREYTGLIVAGGKSEYVITHEVLKVRAT
jgi:DNA polymerase-3 subunit beta